MDGAKKLAYLLEGCGAKYTRTIVIAGTLFTVSTGDEQYFVLVRNDDAGIEMWSRYFTPEQAIAATVGVDLNTGEAIRKLLDKLNTELCNAGCVVECETREERQRLIDAVKDKYAQAIAATVGEEHEMHICKRCGVAYELSIIDKGFGKPRFCPNCGHRELYQ